MKFSATDLLLSDTDNTDKTPCSAPGMQMGIPAPGVLSEGPASPSHHLRTSQLDQVPYCL